MVGEIFDDSNIIYDLLYSARNELDAETSGGDKEAIIHRTAEGAPIYSAEEFFF